MFEEWGLLGNTLILLASFVILDKASDWTITNAVRVSDITGVGKTTTGFILVAFSTSLPELFISIFATLDEKLIGIAIGNVLGSNIVNISLILGMCFLLIALKSSDILKILPVMVEEEVGKLHFGLFVSSIIPLSLIYIGYASRFVGAILLIIFIYYVYKLSEVKRIKEEGSLGEERQRVPKYVLLTVTGAVIVVVSSHLIVSASSYIAEVLGIPKVVIGATIIAFGTSLPELMTSIDSTLKGHIDLALGNIIGSCFTNITCILGVALLGSNLRVNMAAFSNLVTFSLMTNLLLWYFLSSGRIGWREGVILIFMYTVFILVSYGGYRA